MVQSKADRERQKLIADRCQSLIEVLLKDEDNKYCVDCDAKGPRWASWNLGIFLCIRCAGIHRNLGVHISKVKSVNLDAWTPEHVAYVQRMGNSRARAIYEANLPDDFRRPQTDTALESFIRAKYEHKKYIAQDYVDPGPPLPAFNIDEEVKKIKDQKKSKLSSGATRMIPVIEMPSKSKPRPTEKSEIRNKVKTSLPGLVDLDVVAATEAAAYPQVTSPTSNKTTQSSVQSAVDLLIGIDLDSTNEQSTGSTLLSSEPGLVLMDSPIPPTSSTNNSDNNSNNILGLDLDFNSPPQQPTIQSSQAATDASKKVLTKESILSLYSMSPSTTSTNPATGTDPFGMNLWDSK